jgi:hypothetical protein
MEVARTEGARGKDRARISRVAAFVLAVALTVMWPDFLLAVTKVKLHGYITGRAEDRTLLILDDRLETTATSRVV